MICEQNVIVQLFFRMANFNPEQKVQQIGFKENVNKWIHPFRCIIAGPTSSGKLTFMLKMVEHQKSIFTTEFSRIMYCIPAHNAALHDDYFKKLQGFCPNVELILGLPKPNVIKSDTLPKLLLIHVECAGSSSTIHEDNIFGVIFTRKRQLYVHISVTLHNCLPPLTPPPPPVPHASQAPM